MDQRYQIQHFKDNDQLRIDSIMANIIEACRNFYSQTNFIVNIVGSDHQLKKYTKID